MRLFKYLILLSLFLCPSVEAAGRLDYLKGATSSFSCADCSGTAVLIWGCDTTTVTSGSAPTCGCADQDTTASAVGEATITTGECIFNDAGNNGDDYYVLDSPSTSDLVGTVFIKFYFTTIVNNAILFKIYQGAGNQLSVYITDTGRLVGYYNGGATDTVTLATGTAVSTGSYFTLRYRWKAAEAGTDHQMTLYNAALAQIDDLAEDDDLVAFEIDPAYIHVGLNSTSANGSNFKISYVHLYAEWVDTDAYATQVP